MIRVNRGTRPVFDHNRGMGAGHYLEGLFEPRSAALVGASADANKVGGLVLANMLASGFRGTLRCLST